MEFDKFPDDVHKQWDILAAKYHEIEQKYVPRKIVHINGQPSKKFSTPLNAKNLRLLKKKNRLWSKVRKKLASEEQELNYRRLKNQIRRLTRQGKKLMEKNIAKQAKSNPKSFWAYAQSKLKTRAGIPDLAKTNVSNNKNDTTYTTSDEEKANVLQDFFSSVFTQEPPGDLPYFETRDFQYQLSDIDITYDMVKKKSLKLKSNKSPGPDSIHPRVLHDTAETIALPIMLIFCMSIKTKCLPHDWKVANISAIFKKGNKSYPNNYRPVSLTSVVCKVLESIIRDYIIKHMKENNLFSDKQFGFIGGRSTMLQLLKVIDLWTEILDQGRSLDAIYCDFMKAFDKVPHNRLIHKVKHYGIDGNILGWISDFLSNRLQEVHINRAKSLPAAVTSGIPQGSVLGPILFIIYINDLPEVVDKNTSIFLFADDTKIWRQVENKSDFEQLQRDLSNMVAWSNTWLLKFHPQKCIAMRVGNQTDPPQFLYNMEGHQLNYSACEKDLGVHIDNKLNFDRHISNAINKANRVMGIAKITFDYMDNEVFQQIFKGLVRPHLEYASSVWSPHLIKQKDAIEAVQRRATKWIPGFYDLPYNERLRRLKLPTLACRRARDDMIQVYKILSPTEGYDNSLPEFLELSHTSHLRGHTKKLFKQGCNKDIRKYSFTQRINRIWNSLPENVISSKNIIAFEKGLDEFWKDQPLMYDDHKAEIIV